MSQVDSPATRELSDEDLQENLRGVDWSNVLRDTVVVLAIGLLAMPLLLISNYVAYVAVLVLLFAVMATGYNVMLGWPNLLVFCPSAFAILGGVSSAVLVIDYGVPVFAGLLIAGVVGAVIGVAIAYSAIIIDSVFEIVIATLAFEQLVYYLLVNSELVGATGISGIPELAIGGFEFETFLTQYVFLLLLLCVMIALVASFDRSLLGTLSIATGENEDLVRSIGYDPSRYKLISITLGAFILGVGGALFAHINGLITPGEFTLQQTVQLLVIVAIGGLRTIYGPTLGAVLMIGLPELLRSLGFGGFRPYVIGLTMILVILFMPAGIIGSATKYFDKHFGGESLWRFWK